MELNVKDGYTPRTIATAAVWLAIRFPAWWVGSRLDGRDIDRYMPFLSFAMLTPPFALAGLIAGHPKTGVVIGLTLTALGLAAIFLLDYFHVPS